MHINIFPDAETVAREGARVVAAEARAAVAARGRFIFAVSGGTTPWQMLRALADDAIPWSQVHIFQVDERVAPHGHPDRNLTHLRESLLSHAPLPEANLHAMPVEDDDLVAAAARYAQTLEKIAGAPAVLDLIHLGLGNDGHTASLVPGDAALDVANADVTVTAPYQGRQRMTLTYPVLNRARRLLWLATGASKVDMLPRLLASDPAIPAGRVRADRAILLADQAAAAKVQLPK